MPESPHWRRPALRRAAACLAVCAAAGATALAAGTTAAAPVPEAPTHSALDASLFYQLLIGEMQLRSGDPGTAYRAFMDAAQRTKDPQLFRRAMDIALQARAGNEALAATQAWREAHPEAADPLRLQLQILAALNRLAEAEAPLQALITMTPEAERGGLITALPRFFERAADKRQTAELLATVLAPHMAADAGATRTAAVVALGRSWLAAGDADRALALAQQAAGNDPAAPGPALLALEMLGSQPAAERIVGAYLARPGAEPAMRLAYVRALMSAQRFPDAVVQLEIATRERPELAPPYLTLGALQLELRQLDAADAALQRYVALTQAQSAQSGQSPQSAQSAHSMPAAASAPASAGITGQPADGAADAASSPTTVDPGDGADEDVDARGESSGQGSNDGLVQAWLLLAQVAEQRRDFAAAESWLARIEDPQRALQVQARRALLMARQGQVDAAVASLRRVPERQAGDARAKLVAEAQLLRDVERWQAAFDAFALANERFPDDVDLLYEQAMVAEKIDRLDELERLLRRVIELKPDHGHAHNALGYSLADRGLRLPEARALIQRALELQPGDPFITDSLGWVEYRMGNHDEALRLLQTAWAARPDTEIGAHLGEILWTRGQRDEARQIWRQALARDRDNRVLRETLARLQVGL